MVSEFDVVVIGAGHAGCEAALAAARLGLEVALVTLRADRVAQMSCNPAIGGVGKGHLVREIDALGGAMARVADATGIQFRRLNTSRGPAVRATRCQSDSAQYRLAMTDIIRATPNITLLEDEVTALNIEGEAITGLSTRRSGNISTRAVVVTTGTFLNGLCHVGLEQFAGGRIGDAPARSLSDSLREVGLTLGRFKTGTTPRLRASSINWGALQVQHGDEPRPRFSFEPVTNTLRQVPCYITHTTPETHQIIRDNLQFSPLFQGIIEGTGPRYCPSIEDKVVRFAERANHTIFLEPEGLDTDWIYPNGLSTSLPQAVQIAFLRSIPGLEQVEIVQHGYAVEYDYAPPIQLQPSLMTKTVSGLFLAGQINGTSGYEEAAAQGLMAGINAARWVREAEPVVLQRSEAYIGVLIDDLVTKGVDEPYRMFTSRAEHRLTLRESNAEERLTARATALGLIDEHRQRRAEARIHKRQQLTHILSTTPMGAEASANLSLDPMSYAGVMRSDVLKRPDIHIDVFFSSTEIDSDLLTLTEEEIKYAGYIVREAREVERLRGLEALSIPDSVAYITPGLSRELQTKLQTVRPKTLGQASRIPGMTPAALALVRIEIERSRSAA